MTEWLDDRMTDELGVENFTDYFCTRRGTQSLMLLLCYDSCDILVSWPPSIPGLKKEKSFNDNNLTSVKSWIFYHHNADRCPHVDLLTHRFRLHKLATSSILLQLAVPDQGRGGRDRIGHNCLVGRVTLLTSWPDICPFVCISAWKPVLLGYIVISTLRPFCSLFLVGSASDGWVSPKWCCINLQLSLPSQIWTPEYVSLRGAI